MPQDQVEIEDERSARETREKEMQRQQPEVKLQPLHNPCQSKVSCSLCNWWKKEGSETKKSKISLCTISCHKTANKDEIMEDEE
jgi:hypothetical protein